MTGLDIFALIVLLVLVSTVLAFVIFLGMWPSMVAKKNNHPQLEAITVGSWVALIAGGVLWPLILIWAYVKAPLDQTSVVQGDEQ
jgi:uncharacterized BrkB/YihY/UPF0761 family membrane protein